jgi:hypothetical protein
MHFVDDEFLLLSRGGRTRHARSAPIEIGPERAQYATAARRPLQARPQNRSSAPTPSRRSVSGGATEKTSTSAS